MKVNKVWFCKPTIICDNFFFAIYIRWTCSWQVIFPTNPYLRLLFLIIAVLQILVCGKKYLPQWGFRKLCKNFSHVNKTLVYSIWLKRNDENRTIVQLKVNLYITFVWEMVTGNISPVQVSGYVLLIFGIAFIFSCKTEPCSNLGEKKKLAL